MLGRICPECYSSVVFDDESKMLGTRIQDARRETRILGPASRGALTTTFVGQAR